MKNFIYTMLPKCANEFLFNFALEMFIETSPNNQSIISRNINKS